MNKSLFPQTLFQQHETCAAELAFIYLLFRKCLSWLIRNSGIDEASLVPKALTIGKTKILNQNKEGKYTGDYKNIAEGEITGELSFPWLDIGDTKLEPLTPKAPLSASSAPEPLTPKAPSPVHFSFRTPYSQVTPPECSWALEPLSDKTPFPSAFPQPASPSQRHLFSLSSKSSLSLIASTPTSWLDFCKFSNHIPHFTHGTKNAFPLLPHPSNSFVMA